MAKYKCIPCSYIYDESKGDLEHDIKKGIKFTDLPSDWVCPICGASKDEFEEL